MQVISDESVKLLLVDDEERNLDALEIILATCRCSFVRARSAEEALLALLKHEFAALILDIKMPGMDGREICRRLRASRPAVEVALVTGWASLSTTAAASEAGRSSHDQRMELTNSRSWSPSLS